MTKAGATQTTLRKKARGDIALHHPTDHGPAEIPPSSLSSHSLDRLTMSSRRHSSTSTTLDTVDLLRLTPTDTRRICRPDHTSASPKRPTPTTTTHACPPHENPNSAAAAAEPAATSAPAVVTPSGASISARGSPSSRRRTNNGSIPAAASPTTPPRPPPTAAAPREWPRDDITLPSLTDAIGQQVFAYDDDDHFLSDLANNQYSSPSTYPSFTTAYTNVTAPAAAAQSPNISAADRELAREVLYPGQINRSGSRRTLPPPQLASQPSGSTSFDSFVTVDTEPNSVHTAATSQDTDDIMPASTSYRPSATAADGHAAKRQRSGNYQTATSGQPSPSQRQKRNEAYINLDDDDDDPFRDSPVRDPTAPNNEPYKIDLTGKRPVHPPEEAAQQSKADTSENGAGSSSTNNNLTKLSAFQCAICMDDAANLTVTHCGMPYFSLLSLALLLVTDSNAQATCTVPSASTRPCTSRRQRVAVPCAGRSSTSNPATSIPPRRRASTPSNSSS